MFLPAQNEREASRSRVERDQERIGNGLEATRTVDDKDKEIKDLALQVSALKVCCFRNVTLRILAFISPVN